MTRIFDMGRGFAENDDRRRESKPDEREPLPRVDVHETNGQVTIFNGTTEITYTRQQIDDGRCDCVRTSGGGIWCCANHRHYNVLEDVNRVPHSRDCVFWRLHQNMQHERRARIDGLITLARSGVLTRPLTTCASCELPIRGDVRFARIDAWLYCVPCAETLAASDPLMHPVMYPPPGVVPRTPPLPTGRRIRL